MTYTTADGLADNNVIAVGEDCHGRIWFRMWGGISCFHDGRFLDEAIPDALASHPVIAIYRDANASLWFGTLDGGLFCYDGTAFTTYTAADGLLDNRVGPILQDKEGQFWFAHFNSGVTRFNPSTLKLLVDAEASFSLIQTRDGSLWFGNGNQICWLTQDRHWRKNLKSRVYCLLA